MPGKKGNKNALKHGIFAQFIAVSEDQQLAKMSNDKNNAELAYARVRLAAAQKALDNAEEYQLRDGTRKDDRLQWDFACRHWTEIIGRLLQNNINKGETEAMIFETLMQAVRAANDKQNVRK